MTVPIAALTGHMSVRLLTPEQRRVHSEIRREMERVFDPRPTLLMDRAARAEWDDVRRAWLRADPRVVDARNQEARP